MAKLTGDNGAEIDLTVEDVMALYYAVLTAGLTLQTEQARTDVIVHHNLLLYKIAQVLP